MDVITSQLALHLPLLHFFVPCFKFALQTMKKESFCRKQFPGPASLGLIFTLQLPWLLYARTPLPPPSTHPPLPETLPKPSLSDRPCYKLPRMKMPWPVWSKHQLGKGARILDGQLNRAPRRHRGFICSTQAHNSYKRWQITPFPKVHNLKLLESCLRNC